MVLSLAGELACGQATARAGVTSEEVEQAIRNGVKFLKERQRADGSWPEAAQNAPTGSTSLAALALLTAGEKPDSPTIQQALTFLRGLGPQQLNSTYAIGLQTMVFAAADPETDRARMVANVDWLERAQHKDPRREFWPGNWTYTEMRAQPGDNSNTQYALLGLNAASEAGIPVRPEVWALSRAYFEHYQNRDGGWGYTPKTQTINRQHDLRRDLQPDHLRLETISELRVSSRRDDPSLRRGGIRSLLESRHRLAGEPL